MLDDSEEYQSDAEYELALEAAWTAGAMVGNAVERCAVLAETMGHPDVAAAIRESVLP